MHTLFSARLFAPLAALIIVTWAGGCATDLTCDPGQELRGGLCYPVEPDAAPPDAGAGDAAGASASAFTAGGIDSWAFRDPGGSE